MSNKLTIAAVAFLMLATSLYGQTNFPVSRKQVAHIPFSFTADEHSYPAGTYVLESDPERHVIVLRGESQNPRIIMTNREELRSAPDKGELVFKRYGSHFILKSVQVQHSEEAQSLPSGTIERELAKAGEAQQMVMVQAGSK
jgi:hypothetical protein